MSFSTILISAFILVILLGLLVHFSKAKCENCNARALDYMHLRVDGNPDLRYKNNPVVCYHCGATEASIKYDKIRRVEEHKVIKKYQSAYTGDVSAQFELGRLYSSGVSIFKDEIKAREWYEKAAEKGHAGAQYQLGVMYVYGMGGVHQDLSIAKSFYKNSCDNGLKAGCEEYRNLEELGY